jgi:hypothetical protein
MLHLHNDERELKMRFFATKEKEPEWGHHLPPAAVALSLDKWTVPRRLTIAAFLQKRAGGEAVAEECARPIEDCSVRSRKGRLKQCAVRGGCWHMHML